MISQMLYVANRDNLKNETLALKIQTGNLSLVTL